QLHKYFNSSIIFQQNSHYKTKIKMVRKKDLNLLLAISIISILILTYISMADLEGVYTGSKLEERNKRDFYENSIKNKKIKLAAFWDEDDVAFIHIKNDNWTENSLPWIQVGAGTEADPHIIENVTIDASNSPIGSGILIENSNEYFVIRNCTIYGAKEGPWEYKYRYAGIKLDNSSNGKLIENNCSNNFRGTYLYYSNNNMLKGNNVINNTGDGIYLYNGDNNTIMKNNVSNNDLHGIVLYYNSNNNTVSVNNINNNKYYGIYLAYGSSNTMSGNYIYNNYYGIDLAFSNENTVSGNDVSNNVVEGIIITSSDKNMVLGNDVSNSFFGIYLGYNSENNVSGNNLTNNFMHGIYLRYSDNNTLSENNVTNNNECGIYFYYSDKNTVSGNNVTNNNECGIYLNNSNTNTVSGNNVTNNNYYHGIYLKNSSNNMVLGNDANNNYYHGICLDQSNNNTVLGNDANNNYYHGICLDQSNNNTISRNNATDNKLAGIYLKNSYDNIISENIGNIVFYPNYPIILNYSPENNTIVVSTTATLSVVVFDFDGDLLTVEFYDASDDNLIERITDVFSGETVSVIWSGLSENATYSWYVNVSDGILINQSNTWVFKTRIKLNSEVSLNHAFKTAFQKAFRKSFKSRLIEKEKESLSQSQKLSNSEIVIKNLRYNIIIIAGIVVGIVGAIVNKIWKRRIEKKTEPLLK
ncbi:MAG: right-handed parallel beta-helix repeat-containing protein, partial [Promethearchaeota archaeon]